MLDPNELLLVVDESDRELSPKPRQTVRMQRLWSRTAHAWVINSQHQILCHQRSVLKDTNPGLWTHHFGGHCRPGDSYLDAAIRELAEETGMNVASAQLKFVKMNKWINGRKFQAVFLLNWDGDVADLKFEQDEIQTVAWLRPKEISNSIFEWTNFGYEK